MTQFQSTRHHTDFRCIDTSAVIQFFVYIHLDQTLGHLFIDCPAALVVLELTERLTIQEATIVIIVNRWTDCGLVTGRSNSWCADLETATSQHAFTGAASCIQICLGSNESN